MPRIAPLPRAAMPELEDVFQRAEKALGFVPTSFFALGRRPEIARAFSRLAREVIGPRGTVPLALKNLVAYVASHAVGCRYCSAHMGLAAARIEGVSTEKVAAAFEYETSPLFDAAERAALRLAQNAAAVPNAVSDEDFAQLRKHFSDEQIVELVGVICIIGWLNRWNDTMATELEQAPLAFGEKHLKRSGWTVGKHGASS